MKKFLALSALGTFLFLGTAGFFLAGEHAHHGANCPLMFELSTLCIMGPVEHLESLKKALLGLLPSLVILAGFLALAFKISDYSPPRRLISYRVEVERSTRLLFQELYSQGILNPKAP